MALYGMADNGVNIPAERDGAMYYTFSGGEDYIFDGIGSEFEITPSSSSFTITLGTGEGIICGRHVTEVTESSANSSITLDASDSGYIVIRMDLTRPSGTEAYLYATSTLSTDDLNNGGTVRDLPLYQYVTDASGVSSFTDARDIRTDPFNFGGGSNGQVIAKVSSVTGWYDKDNITTVTLASADWVSTTGGYTMTKSVSGMLANYCPILSLYDDLTVSSTDRKARQKAFNNLVNVTSSAGTITVTAHTLPSVDIPVYVRY